MIKPLWTKDSRPEYCERTDNYYAHVELNKLMCDRRLHSPIIQVLAKSLPDGAIIAGGAVAAMLLGENFASDIDIFFTNDDAFEKTYKMFTGGHNPEYQWVYGDYTTNVALSDLYDHGEQIAFAQLTSSIPNKPPIQLIKMCWFDDAAHVIDTFDFTITQFAIAGEVLLYSAIGLIDLFKRDIKIHRLRHPIVTLKRLMKYAKKGFNADSKALTEIAEQIKDVAEIDQNAKEYK